MARQVDPKMAEDVIRAVEAALEVPRRTLQRRLAELVSASRLRAVGRATQRRYQVVAVAEAGPDELTASPDGQQVFASFVERPETAAKAKNLLFRIDPTVSGVLGWPRAERGQSEPARDRTRRRSTQLCPTSSRRRVSRGRCGAPRNAVRLAR